MKIVCKNCKCFDHATNTCALNNDYISKPNKVICKAHQDWPYAPDGKRRPAK